MKKMLSLLCALLLFSLSACGQGEVARGTFNEDSILEEGEASASLDGAEEDETMLQIQVTANEMCIRDRDIWKQKLRGI